MLARWLDAARWHHERLCRTLGRRSRAARRPVARSARRLHGFLRRRRNRPDRSDESSHAATGVGQSSFRNEGRADFRSAKLDRHRPYLIETHPSRGQYRAERDRARSKSGQIKALTLPTLTLCRCRAMSAELGQRWAKFGPASTGFGPVFTTC